MHCKLKYVFLLCWGYRLCEYECADVFIKMGYRYTYIFIKVILYMLFLSMKIIQRDSRRMFGAQVYV